MNKYEQTVIGKIICEKYDVCILTEYSYENCRDALFPHRIDDIPTKIYKNVELLNINGLGSGQVHFISKEGEYILIPWSMIVWMLPCNNEVKSTDDKLKDWELKNNEN